MWSRISRIIVAVGCVSLVSAPVAAASSDRVPTNEIVAQASANALSVRMGGHREGSGDYVAEHDGEQLHTRGHNQPRVPLLEGQSGVTGGALGQDARASESGRSAACAGLVGRNGQVEVGPHDTCLTSGAGTVSLSLGTLEQLGLGKILGRLPAQPGPEPPDLELRIEGTAITATCFATPGETGGSTTPLRADLVGIVDGERVPIAELPPGGGSIGWDEVLEQLSGALPAELVALLEQIPADELPTGDLVTVATDQRVRDQGRLTITALRVAVAPPSLADISAGTVSCGPNARPAAPRTPKPSSTPGPAPEPTGVPTAVPAGMASVPGAGAAGDHGDGNGLGWSATVALAAIGLTVGSYVHRRRHD